jgi:hypothetical protein
MSADALVTVKTAAGYALLAILALCSVWLFVDKDALRDTSSRSPKPWSFARVQLFWWTALILGSWLFVYTFRHVLWPFTPDCLTLLGISIGTTTAARVIDDRDRVEGSAIPEQSEGFLRDILSDSAGLSVHRIQCFLFNLAYGITFAIGVAESKGGFPGFDATSLALIGASSGGYLLLKNTEAKTAKAAASPASASPPVAAGAARPSSAPTRARSDELLDPEDDAVGDH